MYSKYARFFYNWNSKSKKIPYTTEKKQKFPLYEMDFLRRLGSYEIVAVWRWSEQWEVILSSRCAIWHLLGFTVCFVLVKVTREFEGPYNKGEPQFKFFLKSYYFSKQK